MNHLLTALLSGAIVAWFAFFIPDRFSFAVGVAIVAVLVGLAEIRERWWEDESVS